MPQAQQGQLDLLASLDQPGQLVWEPQELLVQLALLDPLDLILRAKEQGRYRADRRQLQTCV